MRLDQLRASQGKAQIMYMVKTNAATTAAEQAAACNASKTCEAYTTCTEVLDRNGDPCLPPRFLLGERGVCATAQTVVAEEPWRLGWFEVIVFVKVAYVCVVCCLLPLHKCREKRTK
jgi:hypothetical protein